MDTITNLYSHNVWANLKLLECCATLTKEQLGNRVNGAFGSIRDTLEHIVLAEQNYFSRVTTGQRLQRPDDAPPLTLAELRESMLKTGAGFIEWAPQIRADDAVRIDWDGTPRDVPKTVILTQVINHATEHRAQIMVMLTQLGIEPPELDSWTYFDEHDKTEL